MSQLTNITRRLYSAPIATPIISSKSNAINRTVYSIISTPLQSSTTRLSSRNLCTSIIDSPGTRIVKYFEENPTTRDRSQFMIEKLNLRLSPNEKHAFQRQLHLDHIDEYSDQHLIRLLATCAKSTFGNVPTTKWHTYPMRDIQSIPGIGHKYSTSSFIEILNHMPDLILGLHGEQRVRILELGGFGFNDSFLLTRDLEKKGFLIDGFTGVDINQQGTIAALTFNESVAKIRNHRIINNDVFNYMKEGAKQGLSENCVVAIRFLAVFDPNQINSFFRNMNISLKSGDIFVFNYSISGDEARKIGAKTSSGYVLKENTEVQMLFHKGDHIQTFLTKNFIKQLLATTGFEIILEREEQILDTRGTDLVRGQNDPYPRITVFVVKK